MDHAPTQFRIKWPVKSAIYHAQWDSLKHLVTADDCRALDFPMSKTRFRNAVYAVGKLWRNRVAELRRVPWHSAKGGNVYLFRCPSVFSSNDSNCGACRRALICPWCWCRQNVADLYRRLDMAIYLHNSRRPLLCRLLAIKTSTDFEDPDIAHVLSAASLESNRYRRLFGDVATGSYYNLTLEPIGHNAVRLQHRVLLLLPPETYRLSDLDRVFAGRHFSFTMRTMPITREKIAEIVSWVNRYPAGMLFGDAKMAVDICNSRKLLLSRTKSNIGVLRDSAFRRYVRCHRQ